MPRKPNYKFERFERERLKAEKKAARMQARADRKIAESGADDALEDGDGGDNSQVDGETAQE